MSKQLLLMSTETTGPSQIGRLDERTKQVGRRGLNEARAALRAASSRASERDAERLARRDQELSSRAGAASAAAAARRGNVPDQQSAAA